MRAGFVGIAVVLALAAGCPAARGEAPAAPIGWTPPVAASMAAPGLYLHSPTLAFGSSGRGLATWRYNATRSFDKRGGQCGARVLADGSFGPKREIADTIEPPLVYGRDRAVALVTAEDREQRHVQVVFGSTSGRFGRARTIYRSEPVTAQDTRIAISERGHVAVAHAVAHADDSRRIVLIERRPGRRFGRPRVIAELPAIRSAAADAFADSSEVSVAISARGDLVVAWSHNGWVSARVRRAGHGMAAARRVGPATAIWKGIRSAITREGAAWVAWFDHPTDASSAGPATVRVATQPAGAGRFAPATVLDHADRLRAVSGQTVHLALDPGGNAFVAWSAVDARLAALDASGRPLGTATLDTTANVIALAASPRRRQALVLWEPARDPRTEGRRIVGELRSADGSLGGAQPISAGDDLAEASPVAAAFDPASQSATVLWAGGIAPDGRGPYEAPIIRSTTRAAG